MRAHLLAAGGLWLTLTACEQPPDAAGAPDAAPADSTDEAREAPIQMTGYNCPPDVAPAACGPEGLADDPHGGPEIVEDEIERDGEPLGCPLETDPRALSLDDACLSQIVRWMYREAPVDAGFGYGDREAPTYGFDCAPDRCTAQGARFALVQVPLDGLLPVTQLYHAAQTDHRLALHSDAVDALEARGWRSTGVLGYASPVPIPGTTPLYRLYDEQVTATLYTTDAEESEVVRVTDDLGIAFYVWAVEQ